MRTRCYCQCSHRIRRERCTGIEYWWQCIRDVCRRQDDIDDVTDSAADICREDTVTTSSAYIPLPFGQSLQQQWSYSKLSALYTWANSADWYKRSFVHAQWKLKTKPMSLDVWPEVWVTECSIVCEA